MTTIAHFMESDHRRCDELFVAIERSAANGDWPAAETAFTDFHRAMEHHFAMEEQELFPAFEQAMGSPMGPTQVMRMEHTQMRGLFDEMAHAARDHQLNDLLGAAETLLILMQQHNMKEENILYPMTDRSLGGSAAELVGRMQQIETSAP